MASPAISLGSMEILVGTNYTSDPSFMHPWIGKKME
jgi:hypothetical protein